MALLDFLRDNWPIILGPLLGLIAIYTLLPRPRRGPVLWGALAGLAALLLGGFVVVRAGEAAGVEMTVEVFLFYLFAAVAVLAGSLLITQHNPARAALSFAIVILATCGIFLLQAGPFLFAATIIVYAGAIIVTFLFVIMLAQQEGASDADSRSREPFLSSMTGFLLLCALLYILKLTYKPDLDQWVKRSEDKLDRIKALSEKGDPSPEAIKSLATDLRQFTQEYRRWFKNEGGGEKPPSPKPDPPGGKPLLDAIGNAEGTLPSPERESRPGDFNLLQAEDAFTRLYEIGKATRNDPLLGSPRPLETSMTRLSEMSGPRPSHALSDLRRDEAGRPRLPAENTVYLGRSLFTDYLLPVELAGTLLLVATVGAIAIASRKLEGKKRTPASAFGPPPRKNP